jgi:hypothetical protein
VWALRYALQSNISRSGLRAASRLLPSRVYAHCPLGQTVGRLLSQSHGLLKQFELQVLKEIQYGSVDLLGDLVTRRLH